MNSSLVSLHRGLNLVANQTKISGFMLGRQISYDRLSNKKITRLESDIELESDKHNSRLINRNPRNLELLCFDAKPKGFWLDKSPEFSWNRLVFERDGRHLRSYLRHWSGQRLIEASTNEPRLARYFKNPATTQAAEILARVIARRCLQSGYLCAGVNPEDVGDSAGPKSKSFFEAVAAHGLALEEPPEISPRSISDL